MKEDLLKCLNQGLQYGSLEEYLCITILQMMSKYGDLREFTNWRPIALLAICYNVLSNQRYHCIS